ncbi:DNA-binding protein [Bifidobacterium pseudolongum subsp. globosum]|uniref:DNA-binding protein n=2 Tax=Bifidobacterium pseudolongum TaxID=1694 RepID=A0A4Q5A1J6_9BIFI|nr:DNA-binding protein [Bifidobacterium pseudolongum subsp. globosum]
MPPQASPLPGTPPSHEDTQQTATACTLRALTAVRPQEAAEQEAERDRPRVSVEPVHALIIIGVLVIALATSLTLLIQQSMSLAHEQNGTPAVSAATGAPAAQAPQSSPAASEPAGTMPDASSQPTASEPATIESTFTPVDLNTASQAQLESVKGIGPVTAANIIAYRASAGRFTSVDELLNVQGIGAKTLEKIRPYVGVR